MRTPTELGRTFTELRRTPTELGRTFTELSRTPTELGRTPTELGRTLTELRRTPYLQLLVFLPTDGGDAVDLAHRCSSLQSVVKYTVKYSLLIR